MRAQGKPRPQGIGASRSRQGSCVVEEWWRHRNLAVQCCSCDSTALAELCGTSAWATSMHGRSQCSCDLCAKGVGLHPNSVWPCSESAAAKYCSLPQCWRGATTALGIVQTKLKATSPVSWRCPAQLQLQCTGLSRTKPVSEHLLWFSSCKWSLPVSGIMFKYN